MSKCGNVGKVEKALEGKGEVRSRSDGYKSRVSEGKEVQVKGVTSLGDFVR